MSGSLVNFEKNISAKQGISLQKKDGDKTTSYFSLFVNLASPHLES